MIKDNIDSKGFRENVGIIISNSKGQLLLASRLGSRGWQFPQGGIHDGETTDEAMYRELYEEVGLHQTDVEILCVNFLKLQDAQINTSVKIINRFVLARNKNGTCLN